MRFNRKYKSKRISEKPFIDICREEWKNAKKLFPGLKHQPEWRWHFENNWNHGRCYRGSNMITFNPRYMEHVQNEEYVNEFRLTVKHEIAHLRTRGHGEDFLRIMNILGANRYANCSFKGRRKNS